MNEGPAVPDLADRTRAAIAHAAPAASVVSVIALPGGASSLTYLATLAGAPWEQVVVKVAPPGLAPVRNRDVLRQARVFDSLAGATGICVPTVLGTDTGAPPDVPPLFVMSFEEGESVEPFTESDADKVPSPDVVEARELAAARMLGALHAVDVRSAAFADEPRLTPLSEVERWSKTFASLDEDLRPPNADQCRQRLEAGVPDAVAPTIIHGDFRLGNMLCRGTDIAAVIDWEIWAIADPRIDLAWFLLMADPTRPQNKRTGMGMPAAERLLDEYERASGREVVDLGWFAALVRYKQAAAAGFIAKNNRRGASGDPHGHHGVALIDAALRHLDARQQS